MLIMAETTRFFGKAIGKFWGYVVVIEPQHLHGLVSNQKVGNAVGNQLWIEKEIGQ